MRGLGLALGPESGGCHGGRRNGGTDGAFVGRPTVGPIAMGPKANAQLFAPHRPGPAPVAVDLAGRHHLFSQCRQEPRGRRRVGGLQPGLETECDARGQRRMVRQLGQTLVQSPGLGLSHHVADCQQTDADVGRQSSAQTTTASRRIRVVVVVNLVHHKQQQEPLAGAGRLLRSLGPRGRLESGLFWLPADSVGGAGDCRLLVPAGHQQCAVRWHGQAGRSPPLAHARVGHRGDGAEFGDFTTEQVVLME